MKHNFQQTGFTLIEVLVYLGLFAILMGGVLVSVFNVVESVDRSQTLVALQQEGGFLLGKLNWALTGVDPSQPITPSLIDGTGDVLSLTKFDGTDIRFTLNGTELQIELNGASPVVLNSSRTEVVPGSLNFTHVGSGSEEESIGASFTLTTKTSQGKTYTQDFETVRYLRK